MKGPPNILRHRRKAGLSLREVSARTGIAFGTLSRMERSVLVGSKQARRALSKLFGVDLTFDVCPLCKSRAREK